jgi:hypothetical protein
MRPPRRGVPGALLAGLSALLLLAGCTSFADTVAERPAASSSAAPGRPARPSGPRPIPTGPGSPWISGWPTTGGR